MITTIRTQIQRLRDWLSAPQIEEPKPVEHSDPFTANFRFKDEDAFRDMFAPKLEEGSVTVTLYWWDIEGAMVALQAADGSPEWIQEGMEDEVALIEAKGYKVWAAAKLEEGER